eukprot:823967-Rhodomonas_salina.6
MEDGWAEARQSKEGRLSGEGGRERRRTAEEIVQQNGDHDLDARPGQYWAQSAAGALGGRDQHQRTIATKEKRYANAT